MSLFGVGWGTHVMTFESLLQFLRMLHFRRKCTMRKNCKKSFRLPKATMLKDHPARLNESISPTVVTALRATLLCIDFNRSLNKPFKAPEYFQPLFFGG